MEVGNGRSTRFWEDNWLQGGPLKVVFPRLFSISDQQGSMIGDCGFWDGLEWIWNFQWRRELFQWELELVNQFHEQLRHVKLSAGRDDKVVWKFDSKGVFSTKSVMHVLQMESLSDEITSYSFTSAWRRELFQWELELVHQLHEWLRPVKLSDGKEDTLVWKFDSKGIFSTKSVLQVLQSETLSDEITSYSFTSSVWRGMVPPRIELFGWFVLIGRVNTKERLSRLGVIRLNDTLCVLCKREIESVEHLFLLCEFTWQVWCRWLRTFGEVWSMPGTIRELFERWTGRHKRKQEQKKWLPGFFAVIWNIWVERNARIFQNQETVVDCVLRKTLLSYNEWTESVSLGG
ncbi:uncharacterized protein LOC107640024 [Arachis ipaensis]|uniref:uncharacterized protein LOC107640024 n=1 Tax=Arachis ipaensis TaxID=130454 RepID=UPI0007AFC68E|nr:uncharacterized protein LOC107640024 [Arachis ipaensis]